MEPEDNTRTSTPDVGSAFPGLSAVEWERLQRASELVALQPGEALFHRGDSGDTLCLVISGAVEIRVPIAGQDDRVVATLTAGATFGEIGMLLLVPRTAHAVAAEPSRLALLRKEYLQDALNSGESWAGHLALLIAERSTRRLLDLDREISALIATNQQAARPSITTDLQRLRSRLFDELPL